MHELVKETLIRLVQICRICNESNEVRTIYLAICSLFSKIQTACTERYISYVSLLLTNL